MGVLRQRKGLGSVIGIAVLSVLAAFLLPLLCFGGEAEGWKHEISIGDDGADSETEPAVLVPRAPAKENEETKAEGTGEIDASYTVRVLNNDGTVEEESLKDYLWCVLAAEMPASFEEEALKAQAVAARTYTLWKMEHNSAHPDADVCKKHTCCQA